MSNEELKELIAASDERLHRVLVPLTNMLSGAGVIQDFAIPTAVDVKNYLKIVMHRCDRMKSRESPEVHGCDETVATLKELNGTIRVRSVLVGDWLFDLIMHPTNNYLLGCLAYKNPKWTNESRGKSSGIGSA